MQRSIALSLALLAATATAARADHSPPPASVAVAGSLQSELGCPGDWDPACLRSWLRDVDRDGLHEFTTTAIPPGSYESKIAIDESWDENYGVGGTPGGANYAFQIASAGDPVTFRYDEVTHVLEIDAPEPGANTCALFACAALVARRRSLR